MDQLGRTLARQFEATIRGAGRLVVAIDGPGCCGKSTLAASIAAETSVAILETDDFHLPRGAEPETGSPLPYRRWRDFVSVAKRLADGVTVAFRPIDWESRRLLADKTIKPGALLVIEGIGSLHPDLADWIDYRIWVDGVAATRLVRVARRNSEAVAKNWGNYIGLEQAYLQNFRPWRSAHLWVCGAETTLATSDRSFSRLIEDYGVAVP